MLNKFQALSSGDKFAVFVIIVATSFGIVLVTMASLINLGLI